MKLNGWDDTIVALATPAGIGAIGVIRLSGANAISIVDELFSSKKLKDQPSHTLHVGLLKDNNLVLDEVVVSLYKSPKSYTGEDVIEISCHGSPYIQQQVIQSIVNHGARLAKPGEFTQRAFLNGKMDLTQAEAVADVIAANTAASQRSALHNIRGGFSQILKQLRENLIQFSALIELELDFSEEDVEFADRTKLHALIDDAIVTTGKLSESFQLGNVIKNGVSAAIIGKPNAGKSTLLNTLLNDYRAIVSEIAGTTRDTIEEVLNINGILFRLIDTAGIREHSADTIEMIGIEKSIEKMHSADIVLYIFDVNTVTIDEIEKIVAEFKNAGKQFLLIANKIENKGIDHWKEKYRDFKDVIFISAKQHQGIEALRDAMYATVITNDPVSENTIVTNARHHQSLQKVLKGLHDIKAGLDNKITGDLLALDIRSCLQYISEITGDVSNEDILDYIFSKFCIGK